MEIGRLRQAEQLLEEPLRRGRRAQILASHDQRHATIRIVDDAGEMVGGGSILASEDRVPEIFAAAVETSAILFDPARQSRDRDRPFGIQPPAVRRCRSLVRIVGKAPAGSRIAAARVAMGRGQRLGDVGPGAETGIDETLRLEQFERFRVTRSALRLNDRLVVRRQAEPGQVLENAADKLRAAAAGVEILDPQQEFPAARPRLAMAQRRR